MFLSSSILASEEEALFTSATTLPIGIVTLSLPLLSFLVATRLPEEGVPQQDDGGDPRPGEDIIVSKSILIPFFRRPMGT